MGLLVSGLVFTVVAASSGGNEVTVELDFCLTNQNSAAAVYTHVSTPEVSIGLASLHGTWVSHYLGWAPSMCQQLHVLKISELR
jgi:hypothetical protein